MALSEDQRALLQLLIAGERYEQIADLLGTSPGEVRDRAHAGNRQEPLASSVNSEAP